MILITAFVPERTHSKFHSYEAVRNTFLTFCKFFRLLFNFFFFLHFNQVDKFIRRHHFDVEGKKTRFLSISSSFSPSFSLPCSKAFVIYYTNTVNKLGPKKKKCRAGHCGWEKGNLS